MPDHDSNRPARPRPGSEGWKPLVASLLHSALMVLAFPPIGLWPIALFALMPLAWAASIGNARPFRTAIWVAIGALPVWAFEQAWVWNVSALGFFPMTAHAAMYPAFAVWIAARAARRGWPVSLAFPLAWTAVEFFRGELAWGGYSWLLVGDPFINCAVNALAASLGIYAVSLLVSLWAGLLVQAALTMRGGGRALVRLLPAFLMVVPLAIAGMVSIVSPRTHVGSVRIAAIQTNLPQDNKLSWPFPERVRDFARWEQLTRQATAGAPDLICWPETMYPGLGLNLASVDAERRMGLDTPRFADGLAALQSDLDIPLIVGAIAIEGLRLDADTQDFRWDSQFNSAFLITDGRVSEARYDKIDLTPFGEYMPVFSRWEWLEEQLLAIGAAGMTFDLDAGRSPAVLEVPIGRGTVRVATPICFEATSAPTCRRLVYDGPARRADVMINLTNDGWFNWWDGGRLQHLQAARWRCIELGTPMVRVANTGICAAIDATGRVIAAGTDGPARAARSEGILTVDVPVAAGTTLYARGGWTFGWVVLTAGAAILLATYLPAKRAARSADNHPEPNNGGPRSPTSGVAPT